jgi:hypothetical protein
MGATQIDSQKSVAAVTWPSMAIRLLALACGLIISACSGQANSGITYATYTYGCCSENTGNMTWHAGQHVTLHWEAKTGTMTADATTHQIVLSAVLTGPFTTVDALKQATSQGQNRAGVRTISAAPVTVNDRTVATPASDLQLPSDLPPGYYNLDTRTAEGGQSAGGGAIVVVAP